MSLASALAQDFSNNVRKRGTHYYEQGRVRLVKGSPSQVTARIDGSELYTVLIKYAHSELTASCTCPHFCDQGALCKHIWATIIAIDSTQYLSAARDKPEIILEPDFEELGYVEPDSREPDLDDIPTSAYWQSRLRRPATKRSALRQPSWQQRLQQVLNAGLQPVPADQWPHQREIHYLVNIDSTAYSGNLVVSLQCRDVRANGQPGVYKPLAMKRSQITQIPDPADREIIAILTGTGRYYGYSDSYERLPDSFQLEQVLAHKLMPLLAGTGRCHVRLEREAQASPLAWDENGPWSFSLELRLLPDGGYELNGEFRRGKERMQVNEPLLIFKGGLLFTPDRIAPWQEETAFEWISHLRSAGPIKVPAGQQELLLASLLASRRVPALRLPQELCPEEVTDQPRACLRISTPLHSYGRDELQGELSFDYGTFTVADHDASRGVYDPGSRRFFQRDFAAEDGARAVLEELGTKPPENFYWNSHPVYRLRRTKLPRLLASLIQAGWHVEAEGKIFRRPGGSQLSVSSGVDWFELRGEVDYGECTAKLPALLEAVRRGDNMVRLDDGTYGMLPEEWLRRIAPLASMGAPENGHIRFRRSQAGLLDALLATQPEARCDEVFDRLRRELASFSGVEAAAQPKGFCGQLRNYQAEGLGWLQFLERFSFGGCLADDMGLGKTAQVLALLEMRREARAAGEPQAPSLVVVPRSLVFNWKQEAARFTPRLRVLDYTGTARNGSDFNGYDVVLTTYGTVRRDAARLKDTEFDYVVLDEAQAVKNAGTESSKAVRLLRARRRLALSGTPVENHLGELWTLFEFLNPGMLGAAGAFQLAGGAMRNPNEETRRLLAHALRPFILRRTKQQVARELPSKTEQTIFCEMEPGQRKLYAELRQHYRNSLLPQVERAGMAKSKIHVLEALLRLRQAACHPGLLDKKRAHEPSAKLDVLLEQLREVLGEGHKALVFSQFTSLLAILRRRLEDEGVKYEYLDGKTRDRQARVDSFQNDPACGLFLISLKAGGLGLNLTAAEYVFILDPWWNPAVEAQAVDRAHRIGQTRQVFAYRLITRDTVEEKVLELQQSKRDLADAIIGEKNSLIRDLRSEDLELLLS